MKKVYFIGVILFLMLCLNVAYASPKQYGKLIDVEKTGQIDDEGRCEVIVTMEINGVTIYLTMWMYQTDIDELKGVKGQMISIYYHWDGNGHRIYDRWAPGNPDGIQYPPTIPNELKHRHGALNSPIPIDPNW